MVEITEAPITLTCAAAQGVFRLQSISGSEQLGTLYEYQLKLVSESHEVDIVALLGQALTVHMPFGDDQFRHFGGVISGASRGERDGTKTVYHVTLSPEQELLSFSHDCRIFQDITVVDVVKQILVDHHLRPCRETLFETYRKWDYLTQYRESDIDFIRRILAVEGIYFYFDHLADGSQMVLADAVSSHEAHEGWDSVPLIKGSVARGSIPDRLRWWQESSALATNGVTLRDFDFRLRGKSAVLDGRKGTEDAQQKGALDRYEYPGIFTLNENRIEADSQASLAEGERLANVRLEEKQSRVLRYQGEGTARNLRVGSLFSISNVPALAGRQFLIIATDVSFRNPSFETGDEQAGETSYVRLTAIDSKRPFRMPRVEKPVIPGPQTARVVGPTDEEIWTDKYGRIKVQFHWDRETERKGEDRSCWVRVAHPWAGHRWGAIHIPRVGNEVVVEFLEGDPDRPLVTGSVYNADNMPPYTLPEHKTQSGIKTRSSKTGTGANFNEIRFEDAKGHEELHIQAERNMCALVKHDQSLRVNGDRHLKVDGNETIDVTKTETQTYNADRKITVKGANSEDITGAHNGSYHGGRSETVQNGDTLTVERSDKTTMVGGEYNIFAVKHYNVSSGENATCDVDLKEGVVTITAANEISLVCGDASLSLKKDGTVTIQGKKTLDAIGGDSKLELASAGATLSGQNAKVSGKTMTDISGSMVTING
jgi:type VI secretion system secreted protein VgrG